MRSTEFVEIVESQVEVLARHRTQAGLIEDGEHFNVFLWRQWLVVSGTRLVDQDFKFKRFLGRAIGQIARNDLCE
jgi:hypothetical protein